MSEWHSYSPRDITLITKIKGKNIETARALVNTFRLMNEITIALHMSKQLRNILKSLYQIALIFIKSILCDIFCIVLKFFLFECVFEVSLMNLVR